MIPTIIKTDSIIQPAATGSTTQVTPITATANTQNSLANLIPGQKYQALVEAQLPNGNSRVLISDQLLQMRLPGNLQPGDQMELTLISSEPKLKFLLQNDAQGKNNTSISTTGRFLGILAQDTIKPIASQALTSTAPLLPRPPLNSIELPVLLQQAISQSGLFYEAHQAQWIAGKKKLMQLQQEPQGRITTQTATTFTNSGMPVHAQSLSLVQQQLTALETGHLTWRGEIWPGQAVEWNISEQPADEEPEITEPQHWKTQLRLTLPQLGEVTAIIMLNSQGVHVKLDATTTETAQLLENNQSPLTTSMTAAGLNVQAVEVKRDDET